jgi:hypothetical protein
MTPKSSFEDAFTQPNEPLIGGKVGANGDGGCDPQILRNAAVWRKDSEFIR